MTSMHVSAVLAGLLVLVGSVAADDIDKKYPLDAQLKVLAEDIKSPKYRELVLQKMLITDLAAEWQRVATADNADSFLEKHGGKENVLADPELKKAFERRVQIRDDFLALMRDGYKRYKAVAPFDKGEKAEPAGTQIRKAEGPAVAVTPELPAPGAEKHWPRFRGPTGQGDTNTTALPSVWDNNGANIRWRVKVPGKGNSSPITWG